MNDMNTPFSKKNGFTIVELTLVIAVLAILFSITAVAYVGVQKEARNAQTVVAATKYLDTLKLYYSVNKKYPQRAVSGGAVCLGSVYTGGKCWNNEGNVDTAFMQELEKFSGSKLPDPAMPTNKGRTGILMTAKQDWISGLDGQKAEFLIYTMEGDERCPVGPVVSPHPSQSFNYISVPPASGKTSVLPDGGSECRIALPPMGP